MTFDLQDIFNLSRLIMINSPFIAKLKQIQLVLGCLFFFYYVIVDYGHVE